MPLWSYFAVIGGGLTVVLLLANFMLAPVKPEISPSAATAVENMVRKPGTTTGLAQSGVDLARRAEARQDASPTAKSSTQPARNPLAESSARPPVQPSAGNAAQPALPPSTVGSAQAALEPSNGNEVELTLVPMVEPKSGRKAERRRAATRGRADRDAGYGSYAQQPAKRQSSAEGTLGPH